MAAAPFSGVAVALVTLFDERGELDAAATAAFAAELVDLGVRAVVVAGSTGEAATLDHGERVRLLEAVRAQVHPSIPVLAGTGGASARQAAELTRDAADHGADALLTLSPPGAFALDTYYDAVAKAAAGRPVIAYHFPAVSPPGIPVDRLGSLPVAGLKDSSGEPDRLLEARATWDGALYTGSSALLSFAGPLGCAGAILSLANLEPELCARAFEGDADAQLELAPAHLASRERLPVRLKELTAEKFGVSAVCRVA